MMDQFWTAEQTAHPYAKADRWASIYNPTPGGKKHDEGTTSFSLRFPALLICDIVSDPKTVAHDIAQMLNEAEAIRQKAEAGG